MQSVKQKMSDTAATAKEHVDVLKAKAGEKAEMSTARTKEGKEIAKERRKAKEAEANTRLHEAKAQHAADKFPGKQHGHFGYHQHGPGTATAAAPGYGHHNAMGATGPPTNVAAPTHKPLGGHRHRHHHHHHHHHHNECCSSKYKSHIQFSFIPITLFSTYI